VFRESGGAFGVREAAMEEQYFRRLVGLHLTVVSTIAKCAAIRAIRHFCCLFVQSVCLNRKGCIYLSMGNLSQS